MKKHLVSLLICGVFLFGTWSEDVLCQTQLKQVTPASKIDQFIKVIQSATSMTQVNSAFVTAEFTPSEIDQLKLKVASIPELRPKIDGLYNALILALKPKVDQANLAAATRATSLKIQLNQNLKTASEDRLNSLKKNIDMENLLVDPSVRCTDKEPTIVKVSGPICPGYDFIIEGKGLGATAGIVTLYTAGRTFPATIRSWSSCGVVAYVASNIAGLRADPQAQIELETNPGGIKKRSKVGFQPLMDTWNDETTLSCHYGVLIVFACGDCDADKWIFQRTLQNDWYIVDTQVQIIDGWGGFSPTPVTLVPNVDIMSARTKATISTEINGCYARSDFYQFLSGPKGLPPY